MKEPLKRVIRANVRRLLKLTDGDSGVSKLRVFSCRGRKTYRKRLTRTYRMR